MSFSLNPLKTPISKKITINVIETMGATAQINNRSSMSEPGLRMCMTTNPFENTRSDYNNQCHSTYGCAEPPPLRLHISNRFSKAVVMVLPQRVIL